MTRSIFGRSLLTAAVALGLGFGLQEAVASAPAESAAQRPYCVDNDHCGEICYDLHGPEALGVCGNNVCYCYY